MILIFTNKCIQYLDCRYDTTMILLHLQFSKNYQNDLLMQMEYQRKRESSELQQTQRELGMAKVNVTHVQTVTHHGIHVQSHTMAYMCTRMHACRDILATCTPSTSVNPPSCLCAHTHTDAYLAPSRLLKPTTRRSCKNIWRVPMETSCTHKGNPFSKQVCIQLCSCA